MGKNYFYIVTDNWCSTCHRCDRDKLHFGKSTAGWVFTLHVIPERSLNSLLDWCNYVFRTIGLFEDECGNTIPTHKMMEIVTNRFYNGLVHRHAIEERCVGQDKYTDWLTGEFE
jgi:hypothetical protein